MTTLTQQQHVTLLAVPLALLADPHPDVRVAAQTALSRMLRAPQLLSHITQVWGLGFGVWGLGFGVCDCLLVVVSQRFMACDL